MGEIIKTPMDLGTIHEKIETGKINTPEVFMADVRLVWKNAMKYNRQDSDIYVTADKLSKIFEKKVVKMKISVPPDASAAPKRRKSASAGGSKERVSFGKLIPQLPDEELNQVIDRIAKDSPEALNEDDEDEIEIDINNIAGTVLLDLNSFMTKIIATNKKRKV